MARTPKPKEIHKETFRKGEGCDVEDVIGLLDGSKGTPRTEIVNRGKMDNGEEFCTVKIFIA